MKSKKPAYLRHLQSSFLKGVGSVIAMAGEPISVDDFLDSDKEALASDWSMLEQDFKKVF